MPGHSRHLHLNARQIRETWDERVASMTMPPRAGTGGLDRWSVTGIALLLLIALLAQLCLSIRAKLTCREHAWEMDAQHQRPKPQPESGSISPSGPEND